jgi:hypothetical protein
MTVKMRQQQRERQGFDVGAVAARMGNTTPNGGGPMVGGFTPRMIQRQTSVSNLASPFGCCNFFDQCNDEILTLSFSGALGLLDWMGFNVSEDCYRTVEFIDYQGPSGTAAGAATGGAIDNACNDPNGIEFGSCQLSVTDFGLYGREGPTRQIFKPKKYCKTYPTYRLDGTPVTSENEWDMIFTTNVLLDDIRRDLITGNDANAGEFDGLENWVRTGYDCGSLNSYVINWNGNPMSGGAGITVNGVAAPAGFDFVDFLRDAHNQIKQRISWSPLLRGQQMMVGDMILVMPWQWVLCLLDFFTCWSVCADGDPQVFLNSLEGRDFRNTLNGGLFGAGRIFLDGDEIPILAYDWDLIKGPKTADIYFLTGAVGNFRIWEGEFLSAESSLSEFFSDPSAGSDAYFSTDGGRVLGRVDTNNLCREMKLWMSLRLFNRAPWAQVRFQNVQCQRSLSPLSPDPLESSFYPQSSFSVANCP